MPGTIEPATNGDTLILLAHLHETKVRVLGEALQQVMASGTVRQRDNELDACCLYLFNNAAGL